MGHLGWSHTKKCIYILTHSHKLCPPLHCSGLIGFNKVYNCQNLLLLLLFDGACTLQRQLLCKYQLGISWILPKPRYVENESMCSYHTYVWGLWVLGKSCADMYVRLLLPVLPLLHFVAPCKRGGQGAGAGWESGVFMGAQSKIFPCGGQPWLLKYIQLRKRT